MLSLRQATAVCGPAVCPVGKKRPRNTRMLGGERYRGDIHVSTLFEPSRPITFGVRFLVDDAQV